MDIALAAHQIPLRITEAQIRWDPIVAVAARRARQRIVQFRHVRHAGVEPIRRRIGHL